jgi:hypothetical protein
MPTATATLSLNLTAIQQLCTGPRGNAILNGTVAPTSAVGLSGDFYFNTVSNNYYDLYGPKTSSTTWPSTAIRVPTTTLMSQISTTIQNSLTSLSVSNTLSSLTINNTNYATSLQVTQGGSNYGYNVATFSNNTSNLLTITNSGTIAAFYSNPTLAPSPFSVNNAVYLGGATTLGSTLCSTNNVYLANSFKLFTGTVASSSYNVMTMNCTLTGITDTGGNKLSAFTTYLAPVVAGTNPVRVHNTNFEVGVGDIFNTTITNNGAFFVVTPNVGGTGLARGAYVGGTLSATNVFAGSGYFDYNGNQLLTLRQTTPTKLTAGVSTSANIITQFNALLDALTAHGLIR